MAHLNYQDFETEDGEKITVNPNAVSYLQEIDDGKTKVVFSDSTIPDITIKGDFGKVKARLTQKYI